MRKMLAFLLLLPCLAVAQTSGKSADSENLGKALEYFTAGKYHEALMIFNKLDKRYRLNPRFIAYMGLCNYKEWNFEKAISCFRKSMPKLQGLSPSELSVYYYSWAESHFALEQWASADSCYEADLVICHPNERGDILTRMGYCAMFKEQWDEAAERFTSALDYYNRYGGNADRKKQLAKMINGCEEKLNKKVEN